MFTAMRGTDIRLEPDLATRVTAVDDITRRNAVSLRASDDEQTHATRHSHVDEPNLLAQRLTFDRDGRNDLADHPRTAPRSLPDRDEKRPQR